MKQVILIQAYDWSGLYVDGSLANQDHSIDIRDLPLNEPISIRIVIANDALENWLQTTAGFPNALEDIECQRI